MMCSDYSMPLMYRKHESPTPQATNTEHHSTIIQEDVEEAHAVTIVRINKDHKLELDIETLRKLLMKDEIKNRYIVVISIAGGFRKGKSFILNFFLRYLQSKYAENDSNGDWLGNDDTPLSGFLWRGGSQRVTNGILMWSKIFLTELITGEKIAIMLLDTQGCFDSGSTVKDCATVFAFSTLISSIQIYNILHNIQEDDLQHLQLFTEYGNLALEETGQIPFQRLQFLVRDWPWSDEATYGEKGGESYLKQLLESTEHDENSSVRQHLSSCFSEISCFLMPHPGKNVAFSKIFDGKISDIDLEFLNNLQEFVPSLLAPENLVRKKINGEMVKAKDLVQYLESYMKIFNENKLPEPRTIFQSMAEANNLLAMEEAKELYNNSMHEICGNTKSYLDKETIVAHHFRIKALALSQFQAKRKMGGNEFSEKFRNKLDKDLEDMSDKFQSYIIERKQHDSDNSTLAVVGMGVACVAAAIISGPAALISAVSGFLMRIFN